MKEPCFCWGDDVYQPAEDTWFAWELVDELPYLGGLGVDVGCGSGALLNVIKMKVNKVIGVDLNRCSALACKRCNFEAIVCNSMSCLREAELAVANLPYLPCSDDMATCESWLPDVINNIRIRRGGYLILVYSTLTTLNPLDMLDDFEVISIRRKELGLEELIGVTLRKV